jgi:hypothetical protein
MNQISGKAEISREKNLISIFRILWIEHIMWTRLFIISTAANLGDLPPVTRRLLQNPGDFANELRKYYGDNKAKDFAKRLTEHLLIAAKLVNDAKMGNKSAVETDRKNWRQNADDLADFLARINPNWSKQDWQTMLYEHLRMTESEASYRLSSQYAADVVLFGSIKNQSLKMADYMSDGISKQFHL